MERSLLALMMTKGMTARAGSAWSVLAEIDPIHLGHVDITDDQVRSLLIDAFQGLLAVFRRDHLKTRLFEGLRHKMANGARIIHYKNEPVMVKLEFFQHAFDGLDQLRLRL